MLNIFVDKLDLEYKRNDFKVCDQKITRNHYLRSERLQK